MKHTDYKSANWQRFIRPNKDTPVGTLLFYSGHGGNVTYVLLSHTEIPLVDENGKERIPEWCYGGVLLAVAANGRFWIETDRQFPDKLAVFPDSAQDEPYAVQIVGDLDRMVSR